MHALSALTWLRDLIALVFLCTAFGIVFTVIVYFVNTYTDLTLSTLTYQYKSRQK